jgi:hypothetical protein
VRWCRRERREKSQEPRRWHWDEGEEEEDDEDDKWPVEQEELLVGDPLSPPRAFRIADIKVDHRRGEAFDPAGGADGKGALYQFGGCSADYQLLNETREWTPANGWRTLRIRGR